MRENSFNANLVPQTNSTYNLGATTRRWNVIHADTLVVSGVLQIYGDDVGGVSCLHTTTGGDDIIKLYQQSNIVQPSGGSSSEELRIALSGVLQILQNNGLMA